MPREYPQAAATPSLHDTRRQLQAEWRAGNRTRAAAAREADSNRIRNGIYDWMTGTAGFEPESTALPLAALDFLPVAGDASGAEDTLQAFNAGNYGTAALMGMATGVGAVPLVGDLAATPLRAGARALARTADEVPVPRIRAYHGTPHDFDRFDMSKIGTGEGAQAYGRGLYFAEKEGVGRSYRDSLTLRRNQQNPPGEHDALALEMVGSHGEDTAKRLLGDAIGQAGSNTARADRLRGALKSIEEGTYKPWTSKGHMYEVDIKADPATFLDWDKPLSEQGELGAKVRALGSDASDVRIEPRDRGGFRVSWVDKTTGPQSTVFETEKQAEGFAESALNPPDSFAALRSRTELSEEELADALREVGVPGVRFLDQMSRDAGEGTRNYVVFDDKLIDIVRKYGIGALLMGGAGVAASGGRDTKNNQGGA